MGRLADALTSPRDPLPEREWALRHRSTLLLLAAQVPALAVWGLLAGLPVLHTVADVVPALVALLVARSSRPSRLVRACAATLGLFAVSAAVVHLAEGHPAAHFHFFVMLVVLAQYEDPRPFALGIVTVVVQHGVFGALAPGSAFPVDEARPWAQALVHGGFVLAAALALVGNWRANETVRRREARARLATQQVLDVAGSALISLDRDGRVRHANPYTAAVLGRPINGLDWFGELQPAAARAAARERHAAHLAGRSADPMTFECAVRDEDGRAREMRFTAALTRGDDGDVNGSLLAGQDVTDERAFQRTLARERDDLERLRRVSREVLVEHDPRNALVRGTAALTGAPVVILLETCDGGLQVTAASGADDLVGLRLSGEPSGALTAAATGRPLFVGDADTGDVALAPHFVRRLGTRSAAFFPVRAEGALAGVLALSWPDPQLGLDPRTESLLELMADEASVALGRLAARRRLEDAALTDPLTGTANRRAWDVALPRELARARRTGAPLAVALLDLNGFKTLNDREGHATGDQALKACVAAWTQVLRSSDLLARLGGDEFGVLLPDCDAAQAEVVAGRLRSATPHLAGAGVGIATWDGAEDHADLLLRADAALYDDKATGR